MLLIALWIGLSVTTAMLAGQRGRSPVGWFCLSLLISPFVALPLVLVKPPLVSGREARPPAGR